MPAKASKTVTERQADKQTDRQTNKQLDRQIDRRKDRQKDRLEVEQMAEHNRHHDLNDPFYWITESQAKVLAFLFSFRVKYPAACCV
jgi:hypothetical protein